MMERTAAKDLLKRFTSSPEFFQICIEIRRRLVTQSLDREWLQRRIHRWIDSKGEAPVSAQVKENLYKQIYITAMEAISRRSYMLDEILEQGDSISNTPKNSVLADIDELALPLLERLEQFDDGVARETIPYGWDDSSLERDKDPTATEKNPTLQFAESVAEARKQERLRVAEAEENRHLRVGVTDKQLPSHHSLPAVFNSAQQARVVRSIDDTRPAPVLDSEPGPMLEPGSGMAHSAILSQAFQALSSSFVLDSMRYQSIPFAQGFYLLDRETGQTWFVEAGSRRMIPCTSGHTDFSGVPEFPPMPSTESKVSTATKWTDSEPLHSRASSTPLLESAEQSAFAESALLSPAQPEPLAYVKEPTPRPSASLHEVTAIPMWGQHHTDPNQITTPLPGEPQYSVNVVKQASFDPWYETVISGYPYPIAHLYRMYTAEQDPRLRLRLLVLVYHQTLKYTAYPLVLQFLQDPQLNDIATYQAISRIQSSSWGAWLDFLRCANESMQEHATPLTRSILQAYRRLEVERPLEDRFLYTQRFLDPLGEERVTYLQLGLLEAMTLFRDSFVHGFTPTVQQAEEDLRVYEPLLTEILQEMEWMIQYPLYYSWKNRGDGYHLAVPLMGWNPSIDAPYLEVPPEQLPSDRPSLFLTGPDNPVALTPLYPLLIADEVVPNEPILPDQNHALYLFDGSSGTQLIYHNLWQTPSMRTTGMSWWQEHLRSKRFSVPHQEYSAQTVFQQTTRWTLCQLERLTQHQQFFPELVISRGSIERLLHDFLASEHLLFILHGNSGVGKTTLLAQLAQQRLSEEQPVVWLSGAEMLSQNLLELLVQVVGLSLSQGIPQPDGLARCLTPYLSQEKPLLIVLDNIESLEYLSSFVQELDTIIAAFAETSLFDRIKFVLSLQSDQLWQLQLKRELFGKSRQYTMTFEDSHLQLRAPSIVCELPPLSMEELEWAYERYRSFDNGHGIEPFCPQTRWEDLPPDCSTRDLLRYPQLLRIAMATFCGQKLPHDLTLESLMEHLVAHVIEERYAPLPIPERLQFLWTLAEIFIQNGTDYLSREQLLRSGHSHVIRALQNPHSDSPFVQLLHLGILSEAWIGGECWIQVSSTLIHSFFLAHTWIEQKSVRGPSFMMPAPQNHEMPFPLSRSYLFVWLHLLKSEHMPFFSSWVHEHFDILEHWIEEFVLFSIRTRSDYGLVFVNELLADPSEALYQCLLRVTDRLWNSNDETEALDLLDCLAQHNQKLGLVEHLQPEILYRQARLCEVMGQKEAAFQIFEEAQVLAEHLRNRPISAQIFVRLSSLARSFNHLEEAMVWLERAQEQLEEGIYPKRLARVIRQQGNLAYEQGDLSRALICYQHSLRIDENCGNIRGMAASLSNLGTVFGARGDFENALSHYYRCLHIHQRLGDRKNMATTLNNIGIILKSQRDNDEAVKVFVQALRLRKSLGLFRDSIASLHHIAVIREQQCNVEEALDFLQECLALQRQYDDPSGEIETLLRIGHMLHRYGRTQEAMDYFQAVRDSRQVPDHSRYQAEALYAIGQLRREWGSLELALESYREAESLLEHSEYTGLLAAIARASAVALMEHGQLSEAEQKLEQALQWAETSFQPQERFECMVEWSHLCLQRQRTDAAKALIDRVESLQEDIQSPLSAKDLLCLRLRLAIRECQEQESLSWLDELQEILETIPHDESFERTAWALFETACFFKEINPSRAKQLAKQVEEVVAERIFSEQESLNQLLHELRLSVPSYSITITAGSSDTYPSVEIGTVPMLSENQALE